MDKSHLKIKIQNEEDFIYSPAFKNSLNSLLSNPKYQDGVETAYAAKVLILSEEEMESIYQEAVVALRKALGEAQD